MGPRRQYTNFSLSFPLSLSSTTLKVYLILIYYSLKEMVWNNACKQIVS